MSRKAAAGRVPERYTVLRGLRAGGRRAYWLLQLIAAIKAYFRAPRRSNSLSKPGHSSSAPAAMFGGGNSGNAFGTDQGKAMVRAGTAGEVLCRCTGPPPRARLLPPPAARLAGKRSTPSHLPASAHTSCPFYPQEASFKEFLSRPENAAAVEAQQRKEAKQAVQLQEKIRALQFREKVGGCTHSVDLTESAVLCEPMTYRA